MLALRLIFPLLCVIAALIPCRAGGSLSLSELEPILSQQPKIWKFFQEHFDIAKVGGGVRIGSRVYPELGGARVGPYQFAAKIKGDPGEPKLVLTVETEFDVLDRSGQSTTDSDKAVAIREILMGIAISPEFPSKEGTVRFSERIDQKPPVK